MSKKTLIPELRFPEFEKGGEWDKKPLDDICKLVRGPFGGALKKEIFVKDGYAVYEQSHAIYSDFSSFRYRIDDTKFSELKRFSVKSGDLIMSCSGTMGKFAMIPKKYEVGVINQALLKLTVKKGYDNLFVKLSLETEENQNKLLSQSAGGAIKNVVSVSQIKELRLAVPCIEEQQKIAFCLSSLDKLIVVHSEKLEVLKDHKKGLIQNLFPQAGQKVPNYRFPEFEKDNEWEVKPFSKYIKLYRGSSPRPIRDFLTQSKDGVNWIKIGDTSSVNDFIIRTVSEKITPNGAEKSRKVKKGELILANSMSYGKTYQLELNGCIYDGWFVLRGYEDVFDKQFLLQLLNSNYLQEQYRKLAAGGIVQNISSEIVYSTLLPKTTKEEQHKIASCLLAIDELIIAQAEKIEQLQQHKRGLMQGLFPKIEN